MAVSDREIAESLDSLFRETNPNSFTSLTDVVQRLQSKLGFDLSNKIDFIRAQITLMFSARPPPPPQPSQSLPPQPRMPPQQHHHTMTTTTTASSNPIFRGTSSPAASHFGHNFGMPRGATEINFAQPGLRSGDATAAAGNVVIDSVPAKESTQAKPKRRGGAGGLNKLCGVSPELQAIVGQPAMPRTEIVRQLWAYIRKNNLQDPNNKRKIICNDELRLVFETDCTDMFQMNKLLAKHITRLDPTKEPTAPKAKKLKVEESSEITHTEPNPVVISEALANFFGASGKEMLQSEIFERFDEYIKVNGLEDPLNSIVVCDAKLQELFGSESIPAEGRYEMLARHHIVQQS